MDKTSTGLTQEYKYYEGFMRGLCAYGASLSEKEILEALRKRQREKEPLKTIRPQVDEKHAHHLVPLWEN